MVGSKYLAIRDFKFSRGLGKKKKGKESVYKITDIEIAAASRETVDAIQKIVPTPQHIFSTPAYPLFDRHCVKERALIGLLLGSDFLVGGLKNCGVAKIHSFLLTINKDDVVYDRLLEWAADGLKMTVNDVSVFVSAFIHEPANFHDSVETFVYMHPPPDVFPKYLKEYTNIESKIEDGPTMNICVGVHDNPHSFLPVEGGSGICASCAGIICKTCTFLLDQNTKTLLCKVLCR